jgi:hypothetical protein
VGEVTITLQGTDAVICWPPVDTTIYGNPMNIDAYLVYYSEFSGGPFFFHGYTSDTCYTHFGVEQFADAMFYEVTAFIGSIGRFGDALDELGKHPRKEELTAYLKRFLLCREQNR